MARKAREQYLALERDSAWATSKLWMVATGYDVPKPTAIFGDASRPGTAIVLYLAESDSQHPLIDLASAARRMLVDSDGEGPPAVVLMDLSPLIPSVDASKVALDAEGRAAAALGHQLGKPASRLLCKLLGSGMRDVTLVASAGVAQLALKLARAGASNS